MRRDVCTHATDYSRFQQLCFSSSPVQLSLHCRLERIASLCARAESGRQHSLPTRVGAPHTLTCFGLSSLMRCCMLMTVVRMCSHLSCATERGTGTIWGGGAGWPSAGGSVGAAGIQAMYSRGGCVRESTSCRCVWSSVRKRNCSASRRSEGRALVSHGRWKDGRRCTHPRNLLGTASALLLPRAKALVG